MVKRRCKGHHKAMGKSKRKDLPDLGHLARPGAEIRLRVTPRASCNAIVLSEQGLKVLVTALPEGGRATEAVRRLLAKAMGTAPSNLDLRQGASSRYKVFVYLGPERD